MSQASDVRLNRKHRAPWCIKKSIFRLFQSDRIESIRPPFWTTGFPTLFRLTAIVFDPGRLETCTDPIFNQTALGRVVTVYTAALTAYLANAWLQIAYCRIFQQHTYRQPFSQILCLRVEDVDRRLANTQTRVAASLFPAIKLINIVLHRNSSLVAFAVYRSPFTYLNWLLQLQTSACVVKSQRRLVSCGRSRVLFSPSHSVRTLLVRRLHHTIYSTRFGVRVWLLVRYFGPL